VSNKSSKNSRIVDLFAKDDLMQALEQSYQDVRHYFGELDAGVFVARLGEGVWSPAENLDHLVRSVEPLAGAMGKPKLLLRWLFGTTTDGSRSPEEIRGLYRGELAGGARSRGRFQPQVDDTSPAEAIHEKLLRDWQRAGHALIGATGRWRDEHMDRYRLPHPLLGKLTVREMLFFTLDHDRLHLEIVGRRLAERATS